MRILLVEDDDTLRATLRLTLERRGIRVSTCADGATAQAEWAATAPDVVVLDLTLPGIDGLDVLRTARAAGLAAPVLVTTARGTVGDRVIGLNLGADDYLAKPFDLDELEARIRALARRGEPAGAAPPSRSVGELSIDAGVGAFYVRGEALELSPREAALLRALIAQPGRAMSKESLFERVFPDAADVRYEAIEVVAYRLRKKLAGSGAELVTLRGLGYLLKASA